MASNIDTLADRPAVQDALAGLLWHVDRRQWQQVKDCLADSVHLDYTSLNGGEPAVVTAHDAVAAWEGGLSGFTATHHLLGVPRISLAGDRARLEATFTATHHLPDSLGASRWTLGGIYTADLARTNAGWRITGPTMTATWGAGNQQLSAKAAQRNTPGTWPAGHMPRP